MKTNATKTALLLLSLTLLFASCARMPRYRDELAAGSMMEEVLEVMQDNKDYTHADGTHFANMECPPILIDDYIGNLLETNEGFSKKKSRDVAAALNYIGLNGYGKITKKFASHALRCILKHHLSISKIVDLYTKYIGDWGAASRVYRFDAIKHGQVVKTVVKQAMDELQLEINCSTTTLCEKNSYDVASIRIRAVDENRNLLPYCSEPLRINTKGPIKVIGPDMTSLRGGSAGFYIKSTGEKGTATVVISTPQLKDIKLEFEVI
jgi:beta-galactosidase